MEIPQVIVVKLQLLGLLTAALILMVLICAADVYILYNITSYMFCHYLR